MNLRSTLKFRDMSAAVAGQQAHSPDSRSADEWIKNYLDEKNKRLNDLRARLHKLLDFPQQVEDINSAYREDKKSIFEQMPGRVGGTGKWCVVSPEDEIISRWNTEEEANQAAWPAWRGIKPSATGATGGARVKKLKTDNSAIEAADIFLDTEHGDKTRSKFIKHPKPEAVKLADWLRHGDLRPSSHGGASGSGGTGAGGGGGGV